MAKDDSYSRAFGYIVTATYETANTKQGGSPNVHSIELTPDPDDPSYIQGTVIRLGVVDSPIAFKPGSRVRVTIESAD